VLNICFCFFDHSAVKETALRYIINELGCNAGILYNTTSCNTTATILWQ